MDLNLDFTMADNQTPSTAGRYQAAIVTGQASELAVAGGTLAVESRGIN